MRIGIDLGGTKIEGIALDGSREVARARLPTPQDDYRATLETIHTIVTTLEARAGMTGTVGVGIPGAPDPDSGLIKNANSTCLIEKPLQHDLEQLLARPVRLANDANCFVASEAADGAAQGASTVFGVIIGTGTGGGIVVNGQVLTGRQAIAGEWGHNPLPWPDAEEWPGPACYCGKRGCIETFLSGPGLANDYERHTGKRDDPPAIVARAQDGDAAATATMARYAHRMARALAGIINVLDPEVIVLGGGMSNVTSLYDEVPRIWGHFVFGATRALGDAGQAEADTPAIVRTRLVRAAHGDSSGVRGAAWLWPA